MQGLLKKVTLGVALGASALTAAAPAEAQRYYRYRHHDSTGPAIVAGVAGLAIGAALASGSRRGRYDDRYYDRGGYRDGYDRDAYYDRGYRGYDRGYRGDYHRGYRGYNRGYYGRSYGGYNRCYVRRSYDPYTGRSVRVRYC